MEPRDPAGNLGGSASRGSHLPLEIELQLSACIVADGKLRRSQLQALITRFPEWKRSFADWIASFQGRGAASAEKTRVGRYSLVRELGRGGMGVVHLAWDEDAHRWVALKLLRRDWNDAGKDRRFGREARALAQFRHPGIVQVFQIGEHDGSPFIAMELVRGASLDRYRDEIIRAGTAPDRLTGRHLVEFLARMGEVDERAFGDSYLHAVAAVIAKVADALHAAHEQGVVHRDVKPGNLMLCLDGSVRVLDFGLARVDFDQSMTGTEDVVGSPMYLAPEQLLGSHAVDRRADVYSLGVTLFELLALHPPYRGHNLEALYHQILHAEPARLASWNPAVPSDLIAIVGKAMEKDRLHRYQTMAEMRDDLIAYARGAAVSARPVGRVTRLFRRVRRHKLVAAGGALGVVGLVGLALFLATMQGRFDAVSVVQQVQALGTIDDPEALRDWRSRVQLLPEPHRTDAAQLLDQHEASARLLGELQRQGRIKGVARAEWQGRLATMLPAYRLKAQERLAVITEQGDLEDFELERPMSSGELASIEASLLVGRSAASRAEIQRRVAEYRVAAEQWVELQSVSALDHEGIRSWRARIAAMPSAYAAAAAKVLALHEQGRALLDAIDANATEPVAAVEQQLATAAALPAGYRDRAEPALRGRLRDARLLAELRAAMDRVEAPGEEHMQKWQQALAQVSRPYVDECARVFESLSIAARAAPGESVAALRAAAPGVLDHAEATAEARLRVVAGRRWPTHIRDPRTGMTFVLIAGQQVAGQAVPAVPAPFYLAVTEVTRQQWQQGRAVAAMAPPPPVSPAAADLASLPVTVSHVQAAAFCAALGYRLPGEAEWQLACVMPTEPIELVRFAWFRSSVGDDPRADRPRPVARLLPNAFGLYDMLGNVWEWCAGDGPEPVVDGEGPWPPVRGGAFDSYASFCTPGARTTVAPDRQADNIGFRPARSLP